MGILLTVPRRYFFCVSFMVFFCLVFVMPLCASVYLCLVATCWERTRLRCITVSLSLSHWYPGSGVVLDYIDSYSLHPYFIVIYDLVNDVATAFCYVKNSK